MKLSDSDRKIIQCVEHNATASIEHFARELKLRPHVVRHALQKMVSDGILRRQYLFNMYRLGLCEYGIYCNINAKRASNVESFLKFCIESECVSMLVELGGDYQFQIAISVRDGNEAHQFLAEISDRFPAIFQSKEIVQALTLYEFGSKRLHHHSTPRHLLNFGYAGAPVKIDSLDHQILRTLARVPNNTISELARAIGIPITSATYRFNRLCSQGVISGCRFLVDLGGAMLSSHRFFLRTSGVRKLLRERLFSFCAEHELISFLIETLGAWDFEVGVRAQTVDEVRELVRELTDRFGDDVLHINSASSYRVCKLIKYPFSRVPAIAAAL